MRGGARAATATLHGHEAGNGGYMPRERLLLRPDLSYSELLISNAQHLERALTVFIDHYNGWRPHRSLDLAPPNGRTSTATWTETQPITLKRRDRLGGLLHEYERAA